MEMVSESAQPCQEEEFQSLHRYDSLVGSEELQKLDVRRQKVNVWVIGLALTGILIAVIENELYALVF